LISEVAAWVLPGAVALKEVGAQPAALVAVAAADWDRVALAVAVEVVGFGLDCKADRCCPRD